MFGGKQAIDVANNFEGKPADDQLSAAKEMGMVFTYMNDPTVWKIFCDTYEAIYDRLGEFDDYHRQQNTGIPSLQDEWPKFIDAVLYSMANRAQGTLKLMFYKRACVFHLYVAPSSILTKIAGRNLTAITFTSGDTTCFTIISSSNCLESVQTCLGLRFALDNYFFRFIFTYFTFILLQLWIIFNLLFIFNIVRELVFSEVAISRSSKPLTRMKAPAAL